MFFSECSFEEDIRYLSNSRAAACALVNGGGTASSTGTAGVCDGSTTLTWNLQIEQGTQQLFNACTDKDLFLFF